jgi:hypothetical protein
LLALQDLLDCTTGDGCQGQFQQAYANLIGCGGIALESDGPYRAADGGQDLCRPARRYSAMAHGRGGERSATHTASKQCLQAAGAWRQLSKPGAALSVASYRVCPAPTCVFTGLSRAAGCHHPGPDLALSCACVTQVGGHQSSLTLPPWPRLSPKPQ